MPWNKPVILVDDDTELLATYADLLRLDGFGDVVECTDGAAALTAVSNQGAAAIVLDLGLQGMDGQEVLAALTEQHPDVPVIIATGNSQIETAVACMHQGAFDYLVKPVPRDRLTAALRKALALSELRLESERLRQSLMSEELQHPDAFADIVTADRGMLAALRYVDAVAPSSSPVLITGETGVGKELVARACHNASPRKGEFVAVNVAGLDEQLFADTLFGHRRGAFTGAESSRDGLFVSATNGTLVLDEIGDLSPGNQIKLLRVLQEREYLPLGTDQPRPVRARIVATTNLPIDRLRDAAHFRQDLFFRLAVHHVHVPSLREHPADVPLLWQHFAVRQAATLKRPLPEFTPELMELLSSYTFPGNVRELESLAVEAVSTAASAPIDAPAIRHRLAPAGLVARADRDPAAPACAGSTGSVTFGEPLPSLRDIKRLLVEEALRRANGNKSRAATLIGATRQALNYW